MKTYAQNSEDLIIATFLKTVKKGFYVDVGANHPDNDSVTKLFYQAGWRGINIEPINSLYQEFTKSRQRDININKGVSKTTGKLLLREYTGDKHGWSTFSPKIMKQHGEDYKEYMVATEPLSKILKDNKVKDIDFLKIDVEGLEDEVVESNDWDKYRPKLVLVENTPGKWRQLIPSYGYREVFFDGLNRYFIREDLGGDFAPELFMRTYHQLQFDTDLRRAEAKIARLATTNQDLNIRLQSMQAAPEDHMGVKTLSRSLARKLKRKATGR